MPSPAAPHRASNREGTGNSAPPSQQKRSDIGRPLGAHDTNSVRNRVLKWQEQGGGVVAANAPGYEVNDDENSPAESKPKQKPKPAKDKRDPAPVSRAETRKRSNSTPRKRVISDEHWKLNRSTGQAHTPPPKQPTSKRIGEYTTNEQFAAPQAATKDFKSNERLKSPPNDDKSKERARGRRNPKSVRDVDEEDTHDEASSLFTRSAPATKSVVTEELEWADHTTERSPPSDDDADWAVSEADFSELSKRRARGPSQKHRSLQRPPKGGIFTHMLDESRRMFAKPESDSPKPIQRLHTRGVKIESWLSSTPDPFVDEVDHDVDVPAPLNTRPNKGKRHRRPEEGQDRAHESQQPLDDDRRGNNKSRRRTREKEPSPDRESDKGSKEKRASRGRELFIVSPPEGSPHRETRRSKTPDGTDDDGIRVTPRGRRETLDTENRPRSHGPEVSAEKPPVPLNSKRLFPSTGAQLSTIPSVETLNTHDEKQPQPAQNVAPGDCPDSHNDSNQEERDHFDSESVPAFVSQLRRRLTTHDDLISVLSAPNNRSNSIRSARSIRTNRSRLTKATVPDILKEMSADEARYMRELKTLVGGVIPVLLTCVLSKSDSAIAAGLFRPSTDPKDEVNFSKPIVDMGVAIERIKAMHKRIPQDNAESLLQWAQGAQRVYRQYLRSWRLGFQDVIVNLAPLEEGEADNDTETKSLDEGLGRDEHGDVIDSNGEKVDVAYLLKRPLVRLKYLAKTFKGINFLEPSPKAREMAEAYQALVTEARRRARDERARLEDESAANIDPTRSRDPMTLGVLAGVTIDKSRRVRARDFFNLTLYHSSGQVIDCRAELLLRESATGDDSDGDLLICEIDHSDRWLLFPPMGLGCVSAGNGDRKREIVVMLRNAPEQAEAWQELLSLQVDEEEVGAEWIQLLGSDPVPPAICRSQSFIDRARQRQRNNIDSKNNNTLRLVAPPSARDVDVPIGEKAALRGTRRPQTPKDSSSELSTAGTSSIAESKVSSAITRESDTTRDPESASKPPQSQPRILHSRNPAGNEKSPTSLKRSPAKRSSRYGEDSPPATSPPKLKPVDIGTASPCTPTRYYGNKQNIAESTGSVREPEHAEKPQTPKTPGKEAASQPSPRLSTTPSTDLPVIPRIRNRNCQSYISHSLGSESDEESTPVDSQIDWPESPPRERSHSLSESDTSETDAGELPPPPPPHRAASSTGSGPLSNTPVLSPGGAQARRRGSSPLKHEYEPSTESDSYSDSNTSTVRHYDMGSESETSATETSDDDADEEFVPSVDAHDVAKPGVKAPPHISSGTSSLSASNSAFQGGYRSVPAQPSKSTKAIASVFTWSDKGFWDNMIPGECSVIVSPGLIETYRMSAADSDPNGTGTKGKRPLVAFELTPLVPIRRGTAIDISIRSRPAKHSKITSINNIMFRSRNPEECEVLYGLINQARVNNPTYIALQNARGPFADQLGQLPDFESSGKTTGWFGWPRRRKSYRASGGIRSLADNSESSVGTMSSAFSALKRFGGGSKMFNIARSTVTSRSGQNDGSRNSSAGSGSNRFQSSGISRIAAAIKGSDGIGLSKAKIRLYVRETHTKWRDMGAARLTILPGPSDDKRPGTSASGKSDGSGNGRRDNSPPAPVQGDPSELSSTKRILIRGKTRGEVLLDVCLGESSFERVARTGIAVSVWEEHEGGVAKEGGVGRGSFRVYMIQMKSEAEASYTFGLVGKLRY